MIAPDVTVLVGALVARHPHKHVCEPWLTAAIANPEPLALTDAVLGATVRILTHRRIYPNPLPATAALDLVEGLLAAPGTIRIGPGPRHWEIFGQLCRGSDVHGNLVADAQHASVAIEHGATWATLDRDFARFPGLRVVDPRA
ncbi:ribonuclease VapC [Paraoerskovia sediminicola]|uniref:Ribonuclease VapC n=1 Tax=Paraoerskovia sediminicola TaxID=1138587 RepID=A0ABN6XK72_9CELL|nr:TA system VapC family ribonuclease toxin [Paraoerskovia sediminicola]BDZ40712.1 ribonuclease VapC [Paraoerskovia sediminicola]BDZ43981.1 ribonuclease VapC [Paraoerskovia sediminicola]